MTKDDRRKINDALASFKFDFTDEQKSARRVCHDNIVTVLSGKPGTSKSTIGASVALELLMSKIKKVKLSYSPKHEFDCAKINKIILSRPTVEAGDKLGFLPGDMSEKIDPYVSPVMEVMDELIGGDKHITEELKEKGLLEVIPLQFMRGRTFKNCVVLLDEAQNASLEDFKLISSRLGYNAKLIVTSDWRQIDLMNRKKSASQWFDKIMCLKGVGSFELTENFRHPLAIDIMDILLDLKK